MKKIILFSLIGLIVLGGGGASAYFFVLKPKPVAEGELAEGEVMEEPEPEELDPPLYINMPALVVSGDYQGRLRYLQIKMSVMTRDEDTQDRLMENTPLIQDAMILLASEYPFITLETNAGKEELRQAAKTKISELIRDDKVESVLFTGFVIQ